MIAARCLASNAPLRVMFRAGGSSSVQRKVTTVLSCETAERHTLRRARAAENYTHTTGEHKHLHNYSNTTTEHLHNYTTDCAQVLDMPLLVSALRQENATDICVIRVAPELKYTDYMIIVSGVSPRHLSAMAAFLIKVFKTLRKDEERHVRLEGSDCDDWKCIDFGSVVVHLMLPDCRDQFELEKLWTLRSHDEQLSRIPAETLPEDFIYHNTPQPISQLK
ncbi:mitochondrial assembly of ribosomal large subunit protein 1 [Danio aesculapii]|uniref:mitochondrial assembly of ribosomal large subunit protein 1 n=1 Tax=Danio aesculapii TaxID=1142201 RepID=UPI0024C09622|nr:mitochondrial assembly of ribosomal large subunit protein 1 [Danio aesculapii]